MSEEYPLKPTDADLEQESLDAQEQEETLPMANTSGVIELDKAEVFAWQSEEPVAVIVSEPKAMTVETHEMIVEALQGEVAALRFKAREWEDRARDMERERDAALEQVKEYRDVFAMREAKDFSSALRRPGESPDAYAERMREGSR